MNKIEKKNYKDCTISDIEKWLKDCKINRFKIIMGELLRVRNYARERRNYEFADKIRRFLDEHSISIRDTKDETTWYFK